MPQRRGHPKYQIDHALLTPDIAEPWHGSNEPIKHPLFGGYTNDQPEDVKEAYDRVLGTLTEIERAVVHCLVDERLSLEQTAEKLGLKAKSYIHRVKTRAFAKLADAILQEPCLRRKVKMARVETLEFRTQAKGHYEAKHVRQRGTDHWTMRLMEDTDANEFNLPDNGDEKDFMFVFGMPAVGMQHFNAVEYVVEDGITFGERVVNHQSSPVTWVETEDEED